MQTFLRPLSEVEFTELITPRINPYLWDIVGGILAPLIALVAFWVNQIDNIGFLVFITALTALGIIYILGNIVFENCSTYTYEFESKKMPNFKQYYELTGKNWLYGRHIVNRKYCYAEKPKEKSEEEKNQHLITGNWVDSSHMRFELTMYFALNDEWAEKRRKLLGLIYWLGITKRNFTMRQYETKIKAEGI